VKTTEIKELYISKIRENGGAPLKRAVSRIDGPDVVIENPISYYLLRYVRDGDQS
jgi:hypothetical protein